MVTFNYGFRLFQSITAFLFQFVSLCLFLSMLKRMVHSGMSVLLKAFVVLWIIEDLAALPYGAFNALFWRPVQLEYYYDVALWTIIGERSISCGIPAMVFFLALDRCLMILLGLRYRPVFAAILCALATATIAAIACMNVHLQLARTPEPCQNEKVCFFGQPDDWQFFIRSIFGTLNFACSLAFVTMLRNEYKKQSVTSAQRKRLFSHVNAFTVYAISSELLLNFLPHASCIVYELASGTNYSRSFGVYSRFVTSVDAIACATMYWRTIRLPDNRLTSGKQSSANPPTYRVQPRRNTLPPSANGSMRAPLS